MKELIFPESESESCTPLPRPHAVKLAEAAQRHLQASELSQQELPQNAYALAGEPDESREHELHDVNVAHELTCELKQARAACEAQAYAAHVLQPRDVRDVGWNENLTYYYCALLYLFSVRSCDESGSAGQRTPIVCITPAESTRQA